MLAEAHIVAALDALTSPELESLGGDDPAETERVREIIEHPNVVGIGIAEKLKENRQRDELAIVFYVEKKRPITGLPKKQVIPPTIVVNIQKQAVIPTDVVELGRVWLDASPFVARDPIEPGNSVGHPKCPAGTLGAIAKRGSQTFLLSNAHVIANNGKAKRGASVLYPGLADRGDRRADIVAKLDRTVTFTPGGEYVNRADCAVARIVTTTRKVSAAIREIGGPTGVTTARRGMRIIKVGRTTGVTTGTVRDVNFHISLPYPGVGSVGFAHQILCTRYSARGDSGALVLEAATGKAIGLHFGGAKEGSVCCPINEVLRELDIQLALTRHRAAARRKSDTR